MAKELKMEVLAELGELGVKEYEQMNWKTKEKDSVKETLKFRKIAYGEGANRVERLDLRRWIEVNGAAEVMGKGISLTQDELSTFLMYVDMMEQADMPMEDGATA